MYIYVCENSERCGAEPCVIKTDKDWGKEVYDFCGEKDTFTRGCIGDVRYCRRGKCDEC